jgi:hypothetical protein
MTCQIGAAPRFRCGDTRDINQPAEPYCFAHQAYVADGVCDKARIAELEAELAALRCIVHAIAWDSDSVAEIRERIDGLTKAER